MMSSFSVSRAKRNKQTQGSGGVLKVYLMAQSKEEKNPEEKKKTGVRKRGDARDERYTRETASWSRQLPVKARWVLQLAILFIVQGCNSVRS